MGGKGTNVRRRRRGRLRRRGAVLLITGLAGGVAAEAVAPDAAEPAGEAGSLFDPDAADRARARLAEQRALLEGYLALAERLEKLAGYDPALLGLIDNEPTPDAVIAAIKQRSATTGAAVKPGSGGAGPAAGSAPRPAPAPVRANPVVYAQAAEGSLPARVILQPRRVATTLAVGETAVDGADSYRLTAVTKTDRGLRVELTHNDTVKTWVLPASGRPTGGQ